MTSSTLFYHIQSTTTTPCSLAKEEYTRAIEDWLCSGCTTHRPGDTGIDIQIQETVPANPPMNFVSGTGIGLAKLSFLESLGLEAIQQGLRLGNLFGPDRKSLDDWVTFRGLRRLIVRGSRSVSWRRCSTCGRVVYFAMGKRYLYPKPDDNTGVFESDLFGIIIRADLVRNLQIDKEPNLRIDELRVPKVAADGLGVLE
jgi:hypothetical protein